MSVDLKKRFDRIVEILIQLQSKKVIKAQELADRFEVSLRTIYRDIKSLEQAGVPIIGEAGSGYSLVDGYRLPPVVFTKQEAMSFIAAEKLMEKFMDKKLMSDYKSAMYKVRSVLKHSERDSISVIENQIIMGKSSYDTFNQSVPHALQTVFESIAHKRQIALSYQGANDGQPDTRVIEPIGLFHENNFWYIGAYCLKREDYRQFRADRIFTIDLLAQTFTQQHISLEELMTNRKNNIPPLAIHIRVGLDIATHLDWQKKYFGFTHEQRTDRYVDLFFEYRGTLDYFARWFMMFADDAWIIGPPLLKDRVETILTQSIHGIKTLVT
ncbi:helix-turn-helix transcriptional regulator [Sphingobacterium yanglingense]|uniref:Putative DNA-binding transcriptional regulator YafY n=1 Tax=Sphingobacterium yanglingense TaxID=1437280 RepID=A0A4V3DE18_9SPHI|nr:YafY family protein [Sphingobacterium yanglingense]TDQ79359.1 putative DNA-binding transcriptional regulator YafY [Sphingobacterium yanglingense]